MNRQRSVEASSPRPVDEAGVRFRVRVNMQQYFGDERALALVMAHSARRVRWLARRLRALFALPPRFALLCAGHLLPPDEPLAVLRPDDLVTVVPSRIDLEGQRDKFHDVNSGCRTGVSAPVFDMIDSKSSDTVDDRHCPTIDRESSEVYDDVDEALTPFGVAQENDDEAELSEQKRLALVLLDQYRATDDTACSEQRASRPRRRRVRRRRRELPPPSPPPPSLLPLPSSTPPSPPPPPSLPLPLPSGPEAGVLRNSIQMSRSPRLIRPLADTVTLGCTA